MSKLINAGIGWIICGQCTPVRKSTMPKLEWISEIVEAGDKASIPIFLKNNLKVLLPPEVPTFYNLQLKVIHDDGEPEYDPVLRQEYPSPLAMGVNIIKTVKNLGIPIKTHPIEQVIKVGLVGYRKDNVNL